MAERFFLNLKMERVWQRQYANHAEAKADINDYIVGFYNCKRFKLRRLAALLKQIEVVTIAG